MRAYVAVATGREVERLGGLEGEVLALCAHVTAIKAELAALKGGGEVSETSEAMIREERGRLIAACEAVEGWGMNALADELRRKP